MNVVVSITGASGSIYAKCLIKKLESIDSVTKLAVVFSKNAIEIYKYELEEEPEYSAKTQIYNYNDFDAPFASGSSSFSTQIICPCSMGTLGRIANGISNDLITRAADVMLKERRKLILVTRESPINLIHIRNMELITQAGGIICPANPSFYSKPKTINDLVNNQINRILQLTGLEEENMFRWNET